MSESFTAVLHPTTQLIAASVGIPGPPGTDGADGADGAQWFTGTGAPAPALGSPGDMYLENDGDVWQSSDASGWLVTPTNIRGPVGATGATGATGSAGAQGPAGSVSSVGSNLLFSPDNTYDIGASGANRPRNLYLAGTATAEVVTVQGAQAGVAITQRGAANTFTWYATGVGLNLYGSVLPANLWSFGHDGNFFPGADNAYDIGIPPSRPRNLYLAGTATVPVVNTPLLSPTDNVVEQRNGTSQQQLRVYQAYTSASDYSRLSVGSDAGNFYLRSESAGAATGGNANTGIILWTAGYAPIYFVTNNSICWLINQNGFLMAQTDNAVDIGASGASRPRNLYLAGTASIAGVPAFAAGDKYLVIDASGNIHRSAIGPAS